MVYLCDLKSEAGEMIEEEKQHARAGLTELNIIWHVSFIIIISLKA